MILTVVSTLLFLLSSPLGTLGKVAAPDRQQAAHLDQRDLLKDAQFSNGSLLTAKDQDGANNLIFSTDSMAMSSLANEEFEIDRVASHNGIEETIVEEDDDDVPRRYSSQEEENEGIWYNDIQPTQYMSFPVKATSSVDRNIEPEPELPWESLWASLPQPTSVSK